MFTRFRISRLLRHLDLSVSFHIRGKTLCMLALKTKQYKNKKKRVFNFWSSKCPCSRKGATPLQNSVWKQVTFHKDRGKRSKLEASYASHNKLRTDVKFHFSFKNVYKISGRLQILKSRLQAWLKHYKTTCVSLLFTACLVAGRKCVANIFSKIKNVSTF